MKIDEIKIKLRKTEELLELLKKIIEENYSINEQKIGGLLEQIKILIIKMDEAKIKIDESKFWKLHKEYFEIDELEGLNGLYREGLEDYTPEQIRIIELGDFRYGQPVIDLNKFFENLKDLIQREIEKSIETKPFLHNLEIIPKLNKIFEKNIKLFSLAPILYAIITEKQSTIIVGKNGVGKSEFLKDLKETKLRNCVVIPANKNLFIDNNLMREYIDNIKIEKRIKNQKLKNTLYSSSNYVENNNDNNLISYLVSFYVTENSKSKLDLEPPKSSKLDKVKEIWEKIFPEIKIFTESGNRILEFSKNDDKDRYSFNQLSDGERSALYYILLLCLFPERSLIVIDEPETHLNIALCNKLWDSLLRHKKNSKFIFISHNRDFISSRVDSDIFWCKNYDLNNKENNEFIKIETNTVLPKDLIASLLGSKEEKVLFCEGTLDSYDYRLYNMLYGNEFHVSPVGGHRNVIEYTKAYNELKEKLDIYSKEVNGIIDGDCLNEDEVQNLRDKNIIVLPVNEIEMLMLHEEILKKVLDSHYNDEDVDEKIKTFKSNFRNEIENNTDKLTFEYAKLRSEKILEKEKFQNCKSIDDLKKSKEDLFNKIDIDNFIAERKKEIETVILNDDYYGMLKICSLKEGQIIRKIVHRDIDTDYIKKAFNVIEKNKDLQDIIKQYIEKQ